MILFTQRASTMFHNMTYHIRTRGVMNDLQLLKIDLVHKVSCLQLKKRLASSLKPAVCLEIIMNSCYCTLK